MLENDSVPKEYEIRSGVLGLRIGLFEPGMWLGRKKLGLTQIGLADSAGVKASTINLAETGRLLPENHERVNIAEAVKGTTGIEGDELPSPAILPFMGKRNMPSQMRFMLTAREIRRMFPPEGREAWVDFIPVPEFDSPRTIINDAADAIKERDFREASVLLEIAENRAYNSYRKNTRDQMVGQAKNLSLDLNSDLIEDPKELKKVTYLRRIFQLREELAKAQQSPQAKISNLTLDP